MAKNDIKVLIRSSGSVSKMSHLMEKLQNKLGGHHEDQEQTEEDRNLGTTGKYHMKGAGREQPYASESTSDYPTQSGGISGMQDTSRKSKTTAGYSDEDMLQSQEAGSHNIGNLGSQGRQDLGSQGYGSQGLGSQGLGSQSVGNQGLGSQGLDTEGLEAQELGTQGYSYGSGAKGKSTKGHQSGMSEGTGMNTRSSGRGYYDDDNDDQFMK